MKEYIEKKTTEFKWELEKRQNVDFRITNNGGFCKHITHERDLPPEVFDAFKDEIRAKRAMGPDEMMRPTGYVRFEMRGAEAVAVREDGMITTRLSDREVIKSEYMQRRWQPVWDKLRTFYEREICKGWEVEPRKEWIDVIGHNCNLMFRGTWRGAPDIPAPIREKAERMWQEMQAEKCGKDEFIDVNGIVWECAFRDGVPMAKWRENEVGWIIPKDPSNAAALAAWVKKQDAKWRVGAWSSGDIELEKEGCPLWYVRHERYLDTIPNLPPNIKAKAAEEIRKHRPLEGDETRDNGDWVITDASKKSPKPIEAVYPHEVRAGSKYICHTDSDLNVFSRMLGQWETDLLAKLDPAKRYEMTVVFEEVE